MTVAEIIAEQRRKCEADKAARRGPPSNTNRPPPPPPRRMTPADIERAYVEDRTYDGKAPNGGMMQIMRKENAGEYVGRDGTRTFCPWRYVSMQDIELPDSGNPYRKKEDEAHAKKNYDPWGRPSGYVGSAAGSGGTTAEYDPWASHDSGVQIPSSQSPQQDASWDDWLAPAASPGSPVPSAQDDNWLVQQQAPAGAGPMPNGADINSGALGLMRQMRQ